MPESPAASRQSRARSSGKTGSEASTRPRLFMPTAKFGYLARMAKRLFSSPEELSRCSPRTDSTTDFWPHRELPARRSICEQRLIFIELKRDNRVNVEYSEGLRKIRK